MNSAQSPPPSVRTSAAVAARSRSRRWAAGPAGLLLLGAIVIGIGGLAGVVRTHDGSTPGSATGAVWVVLLPALVAFVLAGRRPTLALAAAAGAGLVAIARLISDISLLTGPNTAIRPELFYEVSDRAQPFSTAGGAWMVLTGDLIIVGAGTLAARRLARTVSFEPAPIFESGPAKADGADSGPELLAQALESADSIRAVDPRGPGLVGRAERNNRVLLVGFLGILALVAASLGLPYSGGYLAARYLPPELDLWGIGAALAVGVVGTVAVLAAAALPRQVAAALLGGLGVGASTPFLTALAVRTAGAPVHLNPAVGLGLAGAVLVAGSGLLARASLVEEDDGPSGTAIARWNVSGATLTLLVALASVAAWRLPQLRYNGGADPKLAGGYAISSPLALPFLVAAVVPLIGGLLWFVSGLARAGRAVATIAWLGLAFAATQSLYLLGEVVTSASVPNAGFAAPRWSAGPGLWSAIAGIALGFAALAVSAAASRAVENSSALVADEDTVARPRVFGALVAAGLTVLTVIALALPVYRTAAGPSATLVVGFGVNSWGVLALAVGLIAAAWAAGRAQWVSEAIAYPLAGAGILIVRLVIPPAVRSQDGFRTQAGLYAGYAVVLAFLLAAGLLATSARRIRMTDPAAKPLPRRPSGKPPARQPKPATGRASTDRPRAGGRVRSGRSKNKP